MTDFRSDPSDSPEGKGRARRAWDAYANAVNTVAKPVLFPVLEPALKSYVTKASADLVGFWVVWHLHGGFEGLVAWGMHPTTVWRKVKKFRQAFGEHPDAFEFPGIELDRAAYWDAARSTDDGAEA